MKFQRICTSFISSLFLFCVFSSHAMAAKRLTEDELIGQLLELKREMKLLKAELKELKEGRNQQSAKAQMVATLTQPNDTFDSTVPPLNGNNKTATEINKTVSLPSILPTVTTSPYIGLTSAFDASDLVVNVPTMGEDLRLLRERLKVSKQLGGKLPFENRPLIVVSGKIEAMMFARKPYEGHHESDIDLASSELDFLVEASPWALGFISFAFDNGALDNSLVNSPVGRRIANSNIFLKRGFITLGKLDRSPFYLSAGQMFVNFGRYGSALVSSPLTQVLGQTNERQVQIGYAKEDGFSMSGYAFKGDTYTNNPNRINQGGINVRYIKDFSNDRSISVGAGYISNIADSIGMQITGLPYPRRGFSSITVNEDDFTALVNEKLVRRVPAVNAHGEFGLRSWTLMTEYVGAVRSFDLDNVTFNDKGAIPRAMHVELNKKFEVFGKPANASISYGHSWSALAIGLPLDRYSFVFNVSPFKNTVVSLELSRSKNYKQGTTAYLKGADVPLIFPLAPFVSPGGYSNLILLQLGLFF